MPIPKRSEFVAFRASPDEVAMLNQLAEDDGVYAADVIRRLIRREHSKRRPEPPLAKNARRVRTR